MNFFFISVSDLPNKYYDHFTGASALPSLSGNGAYLQHQQHFYELVCNTNSCDWIIMEKKLKTPVVYATSMYLPHDYTCWSWDSKCTCTLQQRNFYFRTSFAPLLRFLSTFYSVYEVKCAQKAEEWTKRSSKVKISPL